MKKPQAPVLIATIIALSNFFVIAPKSFANNAEASIKSLATAQGYSIDWSKTKLSEPLLGTLNKKLSELSSIEKIEDYLAKQGFLVEINEIKKKLAIVDVRSAKKQWVNSFPIAQVLSQDTGKPIFAKFDADWCEPCKEISIQLLRESGGILYRNYVLLSIDVTDNFSLVKEMTGSKGLPTIAVYAPGDFAKPIWIKTAYKKGTNITDLVMREASSFSL